MEELGNVPSVSGFPPVFQFSQVFESDKLMGRQSSAANVEGPVLPRSPWQIVVVANFAWRFPWQPFGLY